MVLVNPLSTQFTGHSVAPTHSRNLDQLHELGVAHQPSLLLTETMMTFAFPPEGAQQIELGFQLPVEKVRSWTVGTENRSQSY